MEADLHYSPECPIVIVVGNFGSGKTEVAVNLAIALSARTAVRIVDLDIVNPYFRCREARDELEARGVTVIYPRGELHAADLPIILPEIRGALLRDEGITILDVGGDDIGARCLSSLVDVVAGRPYEMLLVVNERRPFTADVEGCRTIRREIEAACRLTVTGVISNTHLIGETDAAVVREGLALARKVAEEAGVGVAFVTAPPDALDELRSERVPLLAIERRMLKPWELGRMADRADWIRKQG